ncbi:MAG: hypothetical protein NC181_00505 [Clostridium sp.]|nr:hypothetical protein [Clostridium sp.]MCM1443854.1 hypothetical protein [Candidatus Amulumruptor caecigallinarius]
MEENNTEIKQIQKNKLIENISKINRNNMKFNKLEIENICEKILSILPNQDLKGYKIDCIMSNSDTNITSILINVLSQIYGFNINFISYKTNINKIRDEVKSDILIVSGFDDFFNKLIKESLNDLVKIYFISNTDMVKTLDKKAKTYEIIHKK